MMEGSNLRLLHGTPDDSAQIDKLSRTGAIIAVNPGHDGAFAIVKDGKLLLSVEAEHDSKPRHMPALAYFLLNNISKMNEVPSIICTSGWSDGFPFQSAGTTYHGTSQRELRIRSSSVFGLKTRLFESTHERSHIFCSYGLSPFPQGEPCYVLLWEGDIGSFYEIDERLCIRQLKPVLSFPGYKYSFLFDLADPSAPMGTWNHDSAGKLMALAGFSNRRQATADELVVIRRILENVMPPTTDKQLFADTPYLNCGVTEPRFRELVAVFSETIFDIFCSYAKTHLIKGYPLLIAGGCGLNCDWNSKWRDSGLFRDIFVPPVTNDSGSAIGTAIEAQYVCFNNAKVSWSVYSGADFVCEEIPEHFVKSDLDYDHVADLLSQDKIIAWVQGRSEIGPRALGNRSLLAAPFRGTVKDRLNKIKRRDWYRPIAPVCLEEDAKQLFGAESSSPFMLYFHHVSTAELDAITHVDGSARVQTVSSEQNPSLYRLLRAFKRRTGFGVLCNTSLNRKGRGFINRSSDLFAFVEEQAIDAVVINSSLYLPVRSMKMSPAFEVR
jgi:hydroxymethyl cephem carbamoyltransferase